MLVQWHYLNGIHKSTKMCRSGAERKWRRLAETGGDRDTGNHGDGLLGLRKKLQMVPSFKYLGRILTAGDDDWPEVAGNMGKAWKSWGRLQRILSREGADKRVSGNFLKAVVQQVLLFGAETLVVTPRMERAFNSLMHGAARRITRRQPRRGWDGKWFYPSLEGAMKEAGFKYIRTSIINRQNTVAQYS